jgi:colanic acid/amylovoran biosynthesis glycosyltransferase
LGLRENSVQQIGSIGDVNASGASARGLSERIRIAYLVSTYPAVSHTFILREVRGLRRQNFDIRVASINSPDSSADRMTPEEREETDATFYIKKEGVRGAARAHLDVLMKFPASYFAGLWFALGLAGADLRRLLFAVFYFGEAIILGRWMASQGLRHLHVHFANAAATVGLIASRTFPIEFSFSVHGPDEFYDAPGLRLAEKIAGASFACCIGQFARSQLMKLSPPAQWSKFAIAPLGVDPQLFAPRPFRPSPAVFEILCVGRLVPSKGQHVLVAAIDRLVKTNPNVRIRLVGNGPDRESLASAVAAADLSRHVFLEGSIGQDRILDYYRQADIFVLASFAEGIPVVLMEAMAMEIPCVSTFVAGIPELIRSGIDGILVPPSDECALADAIKRLIDDPALRRRLGVAARRRVMQRYNLEQNITRLAEIFTDRIGRPRRGLCIDSSLSA